MVKEILDVAAVGDVVVESIVPDYVAERKGLETVHYMGMMEAGIQAEAAGSMGAFLTAVGDTLPQFAAIAKLVGKFERISVISYYDYCDNYQIKWSDWHSLVGPQEELNQFAEDLTPYGGGDWPEAAKTAAKELLDHTSKNHSTIVIWYADAPPHPDGPNLSDNGRKEKEKLGAEHFDWIKLAQKFKARGIVVFPVINVKDLFTASWFISLAAITGGQVLYCAQSHTATDIAKPTVNLLVNLMGIPFDAEDLGAEPIAFAGDSAKLLDVSSELESNGFLPAPSGFHTNAESPRITTGGDVRPLPGIATNLKMLLGKLNSDPDYLSTVFSTFEMLLTPENILSLTYNKLFGLYWREICARRKDPRRDGLLALLSRTLAKLPPHVLKPVKDWLDESYNRVEEIREFIAEISPQYPALVAGASRETWKAQDFLEITYSCNTKVLSRVSHLIGELQVLDTRPATEPDAFVPLALSDEELFGHIPHLLVAGVTVSRRPAMLMACVAMLVQHALLAPRAERYLSSIRGKWFDPEINENYALAFVRFILRADAYLQVKDGKGVLTDSERETFLFLRDLGGLLVNGSRTLKVVTACTALKRVRPDRKVKCRHCGLERSTTIIRKDGICGLCIEDDGSVPVPALGLEIPEPFEDGRSYWCECHTCLGHYAVVRPQLLNVRPKCHFCRKGQESPLVRCSECTNLFVDPKKPGGTFVCPPCEVEGSATSFEEQETLLKTLYEDALWRQQITQIAELNVPDDFDLFQGKTLFTAKDKITRRNSKLKKLPAPTTLEYRRKWVRNIPEVCSRIESAIHSAKGELGLCTLCFDDKPKHLLQNACGRRGCTSMACGPCLDSWYGGIQPGEIILPAHLACPFCKRPPTAKVLQSHNRRACELIRPTTAEAAPAADPGWYYAWCAQCYRPQEFIERTCAAGVPEIQNWVCQPCINKKNNIKEITVVTGECPRCKVTTEKISGCDHITCPCGAHWCWVCGKEFEFETIYKHMYEEHSGVDVDD
ncbi:hypothetical protein HK104_010406 [Borealophlyctis nickersoniae]|nr:hypothetical protein HK104_010406 [Borealophlyctis nickersoniae]